MAFVSFANDIKPLFRAIDVAHMKHGGILLDDYGYMSDPSNDYGHAASVLQSLSPQGGAACAAGKVALRRISAIGRLRINSEGMLVSSRNPLTTYSLLCYIRPRSERLPIADEPVEDRSEIVRQRGAACYALPG